MYLQLHYEVQVVGALVDVLQSHNILVLYPGEERRGNSLKLRLDHSFHCEAPIRCDWWFIELNRCVSNQIIFSTTETVDFYSGGIFRLIKRFVKNQTNRHEEKGFRFLRRGAGGILRGC